MTAAVFQDLRKGIISNVLILFGFLGGVVFQLIRLGGSGLILFFGSAVFPVLLFSILYYFRMIGAGDIKLMGVVTGFLGVWDGVLVIGLGMVFAAAAASYRMIKQGTVWFRLERAARFAVETGMKGRLTEYPGYFEKESLLRLGPYLFAGYCLFLLIQ